MIPLVIAQAIAILALSIALNRYARMLEAVERKTVLRKVEVQVVNNGDHDRIARRAIDTLEAVHARIERRQAERYPDGKL